MNENFKIGDKVYVTLNRRNVFAIACSHPCPQPPDEMFVAPAIIQDSPLVRPGDGMIAASVDLSGAPEAGGRFSDARHVLFANQVYKNEEDAQAAAKAYNDERKAEGTKPADGNMTKSIEKLIDDHGGPYRLVVRKNVAADDNCNAQPNQMGDEATKVDETVYAALPVGTELMGHKIRNPFVIEAQMGEINDGMACVKSKYYHDVWVPVENVFETEAEAKALNRKLNAAIVADYVEQTSTTDGLLRFLVANNLIRAPEDGNVQTVLYDLMREADVSINGHGIYKVMARRKKSKKNKKTEDK